MTAYTMWTTQAPTLPRAARRPRGSARTREGSGSADDARSPCTPGQDLALPGAYRRGSSRKGDTMSRTTSMSTLCDPQAPYQKGTVENTNNRLRKYLPRSTEPTDLTNRYLKSICQILNSTPRKCLGYNTPAEVFEAKLMEIQNRLE